MFLRNYFIRCAYAISTSYSTSGKVQTKLVDYSGSTTTKGTGQYTMNTGNVESLMTTLVKIDPVMGAGNSTYSLKGVCFGNGDAPVTINDFKLAGEILKNLTMQCTTTSEEIDNGFKVTAEYVITNTGTEPFTISEIGLMENKATHDGSWHYYPYLINRELLETPITIEPSGSGQVSYSVTYYYDEVEQGE